MPVTTYVLGAGASIPFGFPTATELKREISSNPPVFVQRDWRADDRAYMQMARRHVLEHATALGLSGQQSIDAWLSLHPERAEWGKRAIARQLVQREVALAKSADASGWVAWFFQRYQDRTKRNLRADEFRVVTFNYDRSFEMLLVLMLVHSFGMGVDSAIASVSQLPIVHVYGDLGCPLLPLNLMLAGRVKLMDDHYFQAAEGIRVMFDERPENDQTLARAHQWALEAQEIVFLGFGFDVDNLRRIGMHESNKAWAARNARCHATGFGLLEAERRKATGAIGRIVGAAPGFFWGNVDEDCMTFLRRVVDWV